MKFILGIPCVVIACLIALNVIAARDGAEICFLGLALLSVVFHGHGYRDTALMPHVTPPYPESAALAVRQAYDRIIAEKRANHPDDPGLG